MIEYRKIDITDKDNLKNLIDIVLNGLEEKNSLFLLLKKKLI